MLKKEREVKMLKNWIILISACWVMSSSAQAVILNDEDKQDFETLQTYAPLTQKAWSDAKQQLKEHFYEEPKQWLKPREGKLEQLKQLCQTPESPWPIELFPQSILLKEDQSLPSAAQYLIDQTSAAMKTSSFKDQIFTFLEALKERKETGKGLTFENPWHLQNCQAYFDTLDSTLIKLDSLVDDSGRIAQKFLSKLYSTEMQFMEKAQESFPPQYFSTQSLQIQPFQDEFIKNKLFFDAAVGVYETFLNAYGNLLWLNALKYAELGDASLEAKLPKLSD